MKKETENKKSGDQTSSPEQISAEEALRRMKDFAKRKEKIVAAVRKSQN